jgi:large subunit ribosomal protein L10
MSKPVKDMMVAEYRKTFNGVDDALVIDIRGVNALDTNAMRTGLSRKSIRVKVVKNTLARRALAGTSLEAVLPALDGPSALAFGGNSVVDVARELLEWARKTANLSLKGAVLDGEYFDGADGVKRLSTFPTREEAQARVVTLLLSPARNVVGAAKGPGSRVLGVVKTIQERLEKGQAIAKAG